MDLAAIIRNVPGFPKPGIQFKDITPLLQEPAAFRQVIDAWGKRYAGQQIDAIVGVEARGFIFGGALAYAMDLPFAPARKRGKLPAETISESFDLEYGTDTVEMHTDALQSGWRVVIIDDLLATGGTVQAVARMVERLGATVAEAAFLIELPPLKGRERLAPIPVHSMISFMVD